MVRRFLRGVGGRVAPCFVLHPGGGADDLLNMEHLNSGARGGGGAGPIPGPGGMGEQVSSNGVERRGPCRDACSIREF